MSKTSDLTLPGNANVKLTKLAGDGYTSPLLLYETRVAITGDATGGHAQHTLTMDPQFTCVCPLAAVSVDNPASAVPVSCVIDESLHTELIFGAPGTINGGNPSETHGGAVFNLPIVPGISTIELSIPNVNAEVGRFRTTVYVFRKDVLTRVPLSAWVYSIPRNIAQLSTG